MLNYSTKCFINCLKCTKIATAGAPPQTLLGELTAIQMPMMYVAENEKKRARNSRVYWSSWWGGLVSQGLILGII